MQLFGSPGSLEQENSKCFIIGTFQMLGNDGSKTKINKWIRTIHFQKKILYSIYIYLDIVIFHESFWKKNANEFLKSYICQKIYKFFIQI